MLHLNDKRKVFANISKPLNKNLSMIILKIVSLIIYTGPSDLKLKYCKIYT